MDLKDVLKSVVSEMSFTDQQTILKYLVGEMFGNINLSRKVESVFNEVLDEYIQEFLKQEGTLTKVRDKIQVLLEDKLDSVVEDLFEDDDDVRDELVNALSNQVQALVREHFKTSDITEQLQSIVAKKLQEMVKDVEVDINF